MAVNPNAVFFVAFTTIVGALLGSLLIGAAVGLGCVLVASVIP